MDYDLISNGAVVAFAVRFLNIFQNFTSIIFKKTPNTVISYYQNLLHRYDFLFQVHATLKGKAMA